MEILPTETIMEDDGMVYFDYLYIADGKVVRSDIEGSIKDLKKLLGAKEIRRYDMFGH
jgi:hypothetical protein